MLMTTRQASRITKKLVSYLLNAPGKRAIAECSLIFIIFLGESTSSFTSGSGLTTWKGGIASMFMSSKLLGLGLLGN